MKKIIFAGIVLMFVIVFGVGEVNADTLKYLIIFDPNTSSVTTNENGALVTRKVTVEVDKTLQLEAKLCSYDSSQDLKNYTFNKSDCEAANVTWGSSSENHFTISASGLVTGIAKTSSAGLVGQARLVNSSANISNESTIIDIVVTGGENTNLGTDTTKYNVETDEPVKTVNKNKTVDKPTTVNKKQEKEYIGGTKTSSNPTTGIEDIAIYVVPALLVLGSGIVLRKRYN